MESFTRAVDWVLGHEGGYSADPLDPGGETRYGISKRAFPTEDIASLTIERARELYRANYWRFDNVTDWRVAAKVMDAAVQFGLGTGVLLLQTALRAIGRAVQVDGKYGPITEEQTNLADPIELSKALSVEMAVRYTEICIRFPHRRRFLRGWMRRAFDLPA